jgi:hypothetical protein
MLNPFQTSELFNFRKDTTCRHTHFILSVIQLLYEDKIDGPIVSGSNTFALFIPFYKDMLCIPQHFNGSVASLQGSTWCPNWGMAQLSLASPTLQVGMYKVFILNHAIQQSICIIPLQYRRCAIRVLLWNEIYLLRRTTHCALWQQTEHSMAVCLLEFQDQFSRYGRCDHLHVVYGPYWECEVRVAWWAEHAVCVCWSFILVKMAALGERTESFW